MQAQSPGGERAAGVGLGGGCKALGQQQGGVCGWWGLRVIVERGRQSRQRHLIGSCNFT